MDILANLRQRAAKARKVIALPEAGDERTLKAAGLAVKAGFAPPVLLGSPDAVKKKAAGLGVDLSGAVIRDPQSDPDYDAIQAKLVELRAAKGMTPDKAREALKDGITYAAMLVQMGKVDGYVSGAVHSTADTLRPALQVIKAAKGVKVISAFFMMALPESSPFYATQPVLFYGDSGLVQNPSAEELAHIALNTARSWEQLIPGVPPVIAMLSHSTKGSAKHADVDKVVEATRIAQGLIKERGLSWELDGELQGDAALIASIGTRKAPDSKVAGRANVLIFPDLDAGNIAYKLTERLAGATAIGPLASGMALPINDLSRGCKAEDIVDAVAVTVCQTA
jgi:phosphate acetyltransferase